LGITNANIEQLETSDDYQESLLRLEAARIATSEFVPDVERIEESEAEHRARIQAEIQAGRIQAVPEGVENASVYRFELSSPLSTNQYGYLGRGVYYRSFAYGIMTSTEYQRSDLFLDIQGQEVAQQTLNGVKQIQSALELYLADITGYPLSSEDGDRIGIPGRTMLTNPNGFFGTESDTTVYLELNLPHYSEYPVIYRSLESGQSYEIIFTLVTDVEGNQAGLYRATPAGIEYIG
jgi:hypothetical protein